MAVAENIIDSTDFPANQEGGKPPRGTRKVKTFFDGLWEADGTPKNLADELDDDELSLIGDRAVKEYEIDKGSRADWEAKMAEALDLAMQVVEEKTFPWRGAANVKYPLVTTAAIQFNARAYPAIVSGRNVVKCQVRGNDSGVRRDGAPLEQPQLPSPDSPAAAQGAPQPQEWEIQPGIKRKRADRVAAHMSYQLLDEMEEWEEDTDRLLTILPIIGCCFRKTWFSPSLGRNQSQMVSPDKFVVNDNTRSLDVCPRMTQVLDPLHPFQITEKVRMGLWREVELGLPQGAEDDEEAPHTFLEQHRLIDLDDDGYPEPYIVTVHEDTRQVVRIVPRFERDGVMMNGAEVAKIEPTHYFTKYGFIPNPTGSFYDIGFGWLIGPLNEAVNSTINRMLDAGTQQVTGGGFIGDGLRIKGGQKRFRPGEYKRVQATGGSIKDNVVPLTFPGPSATLYELLGLLIEAAKDISSVKDIMTGDEGRGNEAASAKLARIEQGMKVFSAIYKRIFRSLKKELKKLYDLNAVYMSEEQYFTLLDTQERVGRKDYNEDDLDIQPVADPNMVNDMQKLARAEFLLQFRGDPDVNQKEIKRRVLEAASIDDIDELMDVQPQPNPAIALKADEIDIKKRELALKETDLALKQADMMGKARLAQFELQAKGQELQLEQERVMAEVAKIKSEILLNAAKAAEAGDAAEIEQMKIIAENILKRGQLALESRKLMIEEKKVDAVTSQGASSDQGGTGGVEGSPSQ